MDSSKFSRGEPASERQRFDEPPTARRAVPQWSGPPPSSRSAPERLSAPISRPERRVLADLTERPLVQLRISPAIDVVQETLRFLDAYCRSRFMRATADRIGIANNELLNNALQYCSVAAEIGYELKYDTTRHLVEVRVTNESIPSRLEALAQRIAQITSGDPQQLYRDAVRTASSGRALGAMLGLARVRLEGRFELSTLVVQGQVTVVARGSD